MRRPGSNLIGLPAQRWLITTSGWTMQRLARLDSYRRSPELCPGATSSYRRASMNVVNTQPDARTRTASADHAPRILIADDQRDIIEALRLLLKPEGFQIDTASSPPAVLAAIQSKQFDIVLIDLNYARDTTSGQE